jgi:RND superfamily putative drug exporter
MVLAVVAVLIGSGTPDHLSNNEADLYSRGTQSFATAELIKARLGPQALPELAVMLPVHSASGGLVFAAIQKVAELVPHPFYSRNGKTIVVLGYFHSKVSPATATARLAGQLQRYPGVLVVGRALVAREFTAQVKHDVIKAESLALPLLLLLCLCIFRSVVASLLPLAAACLTLVITLLLMRPINAIHPLSILSLNLVTGAAVGLSIDYSLLLVSRYREELQRIADPRKAAYRTVATAGRTVALSSATVATAFATMLVFPINLVQSMAIGGMLVAAIAGLVSVVVLPAVLSLLGHKVNAIATRRWRRSAERTARPEEQGAWYRLARFVMRYPIAITVVATAGLLALGTPSFGARLTGLDASTLPASPNTTEFQARVKGEFDRSLLDEVVVVARGSEQSIKTLASRYLAKLPDVASGEVRHVANDLWVFHIATRQPPFSAASKRLVEKIRRLPQRLSVTGPTANYLDTAATLKAHVPLAFALLILVTVSFLFAATHSVILPVKALVMDALSLAAAFGLLVLVFQDGRLEGLLSYHSQGALALTQPILLTAATFGIVTDYGIFLLTRIKEGWDSGLSNREAVALGLERTGRIVTAAALLFCIAVGALVTSRITFVKEGGLGVAAAVAIDASIVRALLVPSLMILLGRWNWWCPSPPWRRRSHLHAGDLPAEVAVEPSGGIHGSGSGRKGLPR